MKNLNVWNIFVTKRFTHHKVWKICIYTSKLGLWVEFLGLFLMVYDIDIHQLNLDLFKNLKSLDEISLKICGFFYFFEQ
jgi:hypothetical protein